MISILDDLWNDVGRRMRQRHLPPRSIAQPASALREEREDVSLSFIRSLNFSMSRRVYQVLQARSGHATHLTTNINLFIFKYYTVYSFSWNELLSIQMVYAWKSKQFKWHIYCNLIIFFFPTLLCLIVLQKNLHHFILSVQLRSIEVTTTRSCQSMALTLMPQVTPEYKCNKM